MTKYATIDTNTGYVWWAGEAESPEGASDRESMSEAREFASLPRSAASAASYAVYEIPADLDVTDGQDKDQITAVSACEFVGFYGA